MMLGDSENFNVQKAEQLQQTATKDPGKKVKRSRLKQASQHIGQCVEGAMGASLLSSIEVGTGRGQREKRKRAEHATLIVKRGQAWQAWTRWLESLRVPGICDGNVAKLVTGALMVHIHLLKHGQHDSRSYQRVSSKVDEMHAYMTCINAHVRTSESCHLGDEIDKVRRRLARRTTLLTCGGCSLTMRASQVTLRATWATGDPVHPQWDCVEVQSDAPPPSDALDGQWFAQLLFFCEIDGEDALERTPLAFIRWFRDARTLPPRLARLGATMEKGGHFRFLELCPETYLYGFVDMRSVIRRVSIECVHSAEESLQNMEREPHTPFFSDSAKLFVLNEHI